MALKTCVISPGVVHAVPRTVAMARYLDHVDFIDMTGTADRVSLEQAGIHYYRPEDGGRSRLASFNLQRLLDRLEPDVIVCHYGSGDHFFNAIAWGGCPVTVIAMGSDVLYDDGDTRVSPWRALLTRMGLRRVVSIAAKSRVIAEALRRHGVRGRVDINYWGADLGQFQPADQAGARRRLGLPDTGVLLLSPRAIEPLYNTRLIVEALAQVVQVHPDACLLMIGRSNPGYLAEVASAISRQGLADRIRIVGDRPFAELPTWYQSSDVVISMASVEGFPNTVLEVMACGVPVLAGDIPQVRELLVDGDNAVLCPIDPRSIAQGVLRLLRKDIAGPLAARGRATAVEAGNLEANARRFAAEVASVAAGEQGPGLPGLWAFRVMLFAYLVLGKFFRRAL